MAFKASLHQLLEPSSFRVDFPMYHELLLSNCDHDMLHSQVHVSPLSPLLSVYQIKVVFVLASSSNYDLNWMQTVYKVQFLLDEFTTACLSMHTLHAYTSRSLLSASSLHGVNNYLNCIYSKQYADP